MENEKQKIYTRHNMYKSPRHNKKKKTIYYKLIEHTKHICITSTTYYIIRQGINETCPHTTLHNMGAHMGSSK